MGLIPHGEAVILLAEDDPVVRNMVRMMLSQAGYEILAAHDGKEALELCQAFRDKIDLLLTDVSMPRMNGLALIEQAGKLRPDMRVILMSGDTIGPAREQNRPDAFLHKPFHPPTLLKCVETVLAGAAHFDG